MQLQNIDKQRYRKHLNILIVVLVISLALLSLAISTSTIYLFTDRQGTHFWHNLTGVGLAMLIIWQILKAKQDHPFLTEVKYVWQLKQQLNLITRKLKKIEAKAEQNDPQALQILNFSYQGSKQLYMLDDNTITLTELNRKIYLLEEKCQSLNLTLTTEQYSPALLNQF